MASARGAALEDPTATEHDGIVCQSQGVQLRLFESMAKVHIGLQMMVERI